MRNLTTSINYRIKTYTSQVTLQFLQQTINHITQFATMPSGFPTLQPAFTVRVNIDAPMAVGGQAGSQLVIVPMVSGTVKSEDDFEPKFNGEL